MGIIKLKTRGQQDKDLTGDPTVNFLVKQYSRYTNFSVDQIKLYFRENVDFGKKITMEIPRKADFLHKLYFCFTLPALVAQDNTYAAWTNSIGHAIIDYIDLEIGDKTISKHYGLFLEIWEELSGDDKNENLLIGKIGNMESVKINAKYESTYMVPLQFWFCKGIETALPLLSLNYHRVKISIKLKTFEECIIYDGNVSPKKVKFQEAYILTDYIFLDETERLILKSKPREILIEQLQYFDNQDDNTGEVFNINIPFNHPIKELLWVFIENISIENNDWFNFGKRNDTAFTKVFSLMKNCSFLVEGKEYEERKDEMIYRLINSKRYHKNMTDKHIYLISFSNKPEEYQPSGSLNFSRIDNATLIGDMRTPTSSHKLFVFGINYNWLLLENGMATLKYIS